MKLYKIRFTVEARAIGKVTEFDVILEGDEALSQSGDWSAANAASSDLMEIYFGDSEGYWARRVTVDDGPHGGIIFLYNHDEPNAVSQIWRSIQIDVAQLYVSSKWPLSLGDRFTARQGGRNVIECTWRVINRSF